MAHYAWLNENNLVINVTVGVDEDIVQQGVGGSTEAWEAFYYQATGHTIKRTSYNNNIRKQYAGIGYTYNPVNDVFIAPQPYPSWSLDENNVVTEVITGIDETELIEGLEIGRAHV